MRVCACALTQAVGAALALLEQRPLAEGGRAGLGEAADGPRRAHAAGARVGLPGLAGQEHVPAAQAVAQRPRPAGAGGGGGVGVAAGQGGQCGSAVLCGGAHTQTHTHAHTRTHTHTRV